MDCGRRKGEIIGEHLQTLWSVHLPLAPQFILMCVSYVPVDFVYRMYYMAHFAANPISRTIKSETRFSARDSGSGEVLKVNC